nr:hypothetical protein [Nocardia suismassiliense]
MDALGGGDHLPELPALDVLTNVNHRRTHGFRMITGTAVKHPYRAVFPLDCGFHAGGAVTGDNARPASDDHDIAAASQRTMRRSGV